MPDRDEGEGGKEETKKNRDAVRDGRERDKERAGGKCRAGGGSKAGRRIYIFFMILFISLGSLLSLFPSQVLLGGGCAQKADQVKLLP